LSWAEGDQWLVSSGQDGSVYQWDVDEGKRAGEYNQKGVGYSSAFMSVRDNVVIAAGSDMTIKEMELPDMIVNKELDMGVQVRW